MDLIRDVCVGLASSAVIAAIFDLGNPLARLMVRVAASLLSDPKEASRRFEEWSAHLDEGCDSTISRVVTAMSFIVAACREDNRRGAVSLSIEDGDDDWHLDVDLTKLTPFNLLHSWRAWRDFRRHDVWSKIPMLSRDAKPVPFKVRWHIRSKASLHIQRKR